MPDEVAAGAQLERGLERRHGCPPDCRACRAARAANTQPTLRQRFGTLIDGDSGMRFARAWVEERIGFPPFSDEPYEQWLVEEALVLRYQAEVGIEKRREQARAEAREQAQKLLAQLKAGKGIKG